MHDKLLDYVPENETELNDLIDSMNFNPDRFREAVADYQYRQKVELAKEEAESRGISDVALFINGREYQKYPGTFDDFLRAVEAELGEIGSDGE